MNIRSVIRWILGLAAAPKILAELDFKPPVVAKEIEWTTFEGILPRIIASSNIVEYVPSSFNLDYMYEFVKNYYNGNQSKNTKERI